MDTVTVYSLIGTPITQPSGFNIALSAAVRTDQTSGFDFAYTIINGEHVFLSQNVLGLGATGQTFFPGFIATDTPFDQITEAQTNGYITNDTIRPVVDSKYYLRSSISNCTQYGVPNYGKMHVLSFDDSAKSITFEVLVNRNCGYKGLSPGTPEK